MKNKYIIKFHFYEGKSLISFFIKWRTCGKYSHVSIELDGIVYEAKEFKGVVKSNDKYKYNAIGTCTRTIELDLRFYDKWLAFKKSLDEKVGGKYDWYAILNFLGNWNKHNPLKWFCSELADTVWQFLSNYEPEYELVSPDLECQKLESYNAGVKL